MAFKMKNPGMGKLAKAAGSPAKFGIEHKGIDSAARGTKGIGPDGEPMKMKKDFGMEGSAMKFKGIREKIASRKKHKETRDPDLKKKEGETYKDVKARRDAQKAKSKEQFDKGLKANKGIGQDIAMTQTSKAETKGRKIKEFTTDAEGDVTMSKVKTRGGKRITKTVDAKGKKTKTVENVGKKKKLQKQLDKVNEVPIIVEGSKLDKKRAKLEKKIAKTTKKPKTSNRRAAGETVQGIRHSQTVKKKQKDILEDFDEKSVKPTKERNQQKKAKFDADVAAYEKQGYTVDRKPGDKKPPTKMRKQSAFKDDGKVTVDLTKKGKKTKKEGEEKTKTTYTPPKKTPSGDAYYASLTDAEKKAADEKYIKANTKTTTVKEPGKTTTTPDKKKSLSYTPEKAPEFPGFGTGKFNTLDPTSKNKNKPGKNRKPNKGGRGTGLVNKKKKKNKPNKVKQFVTTACPAISKGKN